MAYLEPSLDWESRVGSFVDKAVAPLTADEELQMIDVAIGLNGTCPSCDGTGYERVDVDEVGPCTDTRCTVRDNAPAVDPDEAFRKSHYGWTEAEWDREVARQNLEADGFTWASRHRSTYYGKQD